MIRFIAETLKLTALLGLVAAVAAAVLLAQA